ncbi:MAG: zinc ribbon domain-containing protein [Roseburia sp.]|nr:zinc ribbon domain-containing protein [Roseburia sp.]
MSKCRQCNLEILDETDRCPLCSSVLEHTIAVENMYPNAKVKTRKWVFMSKVYLFCAIVLEVILYGINYVDNYKIGWSLITGLILLYGYLVIQLTILGQAGHKIKIVLLAAITFVMMVVLDLLIGYKGWSVNYALPTCIIILDIGIAVLMLINRRNWQSYIMWQILMLLVSGAMILLYIFGIMTSPYMMGIAVMCSGMLFLGTLIFGDRRARVEVQRRFHI